jgi:enolase-phosphatase E1
MISFRGQLVLLDIEGTTSDIAFVRDVLFPYARREVRAFLGSNASLPSLRAALDRMAQDAAAADLAAWCPHPFPSDAATDWICNAVHRLMDTDSKSTGLKALQGLLWEAGYRDGTLRAHVYPEVPAALEHWKKNGLQLAIYSSGSIAAQRLFFGHSIAGDLTPLFSGFFDTTSGPKRSVDSYRNIARSLDRDAAQLLFLSDIPEELDAAKSAGFSTGLVVRPGNAPVPAPAHPVVTSFDELDAVSDAAS